MAIRPVREYVDLPDDLVLVHVGGSPHFGSLTNLADAAKKKAKRAVYIVDKPLGNKLDVLACELGIDVRVVTPL